MGLPMKFPVAKLKPAGGEIYAHIFENRHTGLARNLFWSFRIEFKPLRYGEDDSEWTCSMMTEWITFPIFDWKQLEGQELDVSDGERGIESSFYMTSHDPGVRGKLAISQRKANVFRVALDMTVNFHGYYGDDADPEMRVRTEADIPFEKVAFNSGNLFPKPKNIAEANAIATKYLDLATFHPMQKNGDQFVLQPKW